jgi:hypothetical protein
VVPIELDEIYAALDKLNVALGPNGANEKGALAQLVHVGAANLPVTARACMTPSTGSPRC